ncbi:cache domain-containing protein, partial [Paenibacillus sepulcri]|nr:cache domain-containing protein [Paenibacillus sepulcri]
MPMFDWLGWRKGLPLWWSYRLNADLKEDVEDSFEGIADTRMNLLQAWTAEYWDHLDRLSGQLSALRQGASILSADNQTIWERLFTGTHTRASDFSEIYLLNAAGKVVFSTCESHIGQLYGKEDPIAGGISYSRETKEGRKCLFGPYADPWTLKIGPSSSSFHDKMTLLFITPIMEEGVWCGAVCGRVPNDVIGDLIQRESGHVYPDSGDNYIFMAKPGLSSDIAPGTAL